MITDRQQRIIEALTRLAGASQDQVTQRQIERIIQDLDNQSGDTFTAGNFLDSTSVAIGRNIQKIINRNEFPESLLVPIRILIDELKPTIFLSYARKDDEPFVKRLYEDLTGLGFMVWWDRKNMPSRGNTFLKEIRDAIATADRVIAVCGPAYRESVTCRAELDHAHNACTIITPILRLGNYDVLPPDIMMIHTVDMRDARPYKAGLEELLDKLGDRAAPPAVLLGVPALPAHYLPRHDDLHVVAELVMADATTPTVITSMKQTAALLGMGGIGKSVIATAFCRECATRRFFTHGIVWIQVGLTPSLLSLLNGITSALGDLQNYRTEPDAQTGLQKLLTNKCCLIVLDDVWDAKYAVPFRNAIAGTPCRLLVTTRNMQIPSLLGAQEHQVGLLSKEESVALLEQWTGKSDPDHATIAEKLGYLPLALRLAGALMQEGYRPQEWLKGFDRVSRITLDIPSPNRDDSLDVSIGMSVDAAFPEPEADRNLLYYTFGIFQGDTHIPQTVVLKMWKQVRPDLDEFTLIRALDRLVRLALVERHEDKTLTHHDLLHDYTAEKLGEGAKQTHNSLLAACNPERKPWHEIPDDGYLYDFLAYHLEEAGRLDDLHGLFASHAWMHARFEQCGHTYRGFIADVMAAWEQVAYPEAIRQIEAGEEPIALTDCVRYALIRTSINSLAGNYMPELVAQAVKIELPGWSVQRAAAIANDISDVEQKAKLYIDLLATGKLADPQQGLEAATAIQNKRSRAETLVALARQLGGEQRELALGRALEAALSLADEHERIKALSTVASLLTGEKLECALEAALSLNDEVNRDVVLNALSGQLSGELWERALKATLAIKWAGSRASVLAGLANGIEGSRRQEILENALDAVLTIDNKWTRAEYLERLAGSLDGRLLERGLKATLDLPDDHDWTSAFCIRTLGVLADKLEGTRKQGILSQALDRTMRLSKVWQRMLALGALTGRLEGEQKQRAIDLALRNLENSLLTGHVDKIQLGLLAELAPQLEGESMQRALKIAFALPKDMWGKSHVAEALEKISDHLKGRSLENALEMALSIENRQERNKALEALGGRLQGKLLERALETFVTIRDEQDRSRVLAVLSEGLEGSQKQRIQQYALEAALAIEDEDSRARNLVLLSCILNGEQKRAATEHALESTSSIYPKRDHFACFDTLEVAGTLDQTLFERALEAAFTFTSVSDRIDALEDLADKLEGKQKQTVLKHALKAVLSIRDREDRSIELALLAEKMEGKQRQLVLQYELKATLAIRDEETRAERLEAIAEDLEDRQLGRALNAILAIKEEATRARTLRAVAGKLQGRQIDRVLKVVLAFEETILRAWVVESLANKLDRKQIDRALNTDLTVESVCALADGLKGARKQEILEATLFFIPSIENDCARADALKALAERLEGNLVDRALGVALNLNWDYSSGTIIVALFGKLDEKQKATAFGRVLEKILANRHDSIRAEALVALVGEMNGEQNNSVVEHALASALAVDDNNTRAQTLVNLADKLDGEQKHLVLGHALDAALVIEDGSKRVAFLSGLATKLDGKEKQLALERALEGALAIEREWDRADALMTMAQQVDGEVREQVIDLILKIAVATPDKSLRGNLMFFLAPQMQNTNQQKLLVQHLLRLRADKRDAVLRTLAIKTLFEPSAMPQEVVSAVALSLADICRAWRWK
jgi:hypothetical protein